MTNVANKNFTYTGEFILNLNSSTFNIFLRAWNVLKLKFVGVRDENVIPTYIIT